MEDQQKNGAIQRKIVRLVLGISLLALLLSALVSFVSIRFTSDKMTAARRWDTLQLLTVRRL